MAEINRKTIFGKLNHIAYKSFEGAKAIEGFCAKRTASSEGE